MSETEEIAKAIQESAKLGNKGLEIADKAGNFFAKVFKEPIDEISRMITDKLRFIRWSRLVQMSDEVEKILVKKGVNETRAVSPKIALPIFEQSSLENNPDLQSLWNHLLANAMNPKFNDEVRYGFTEMIKNITAIEVRILSDFYHILEKDNRLTPLSKIHQYGLKKEQFIKGLKMSPDQYAISVNNLMRMQLLGPAVLKSGPQMGPELMTFFKGIDIVILTPLAVKFIEACMK